MNRTARWIVLAVLAVAAMGAARIAHRASLVSTPPPSVAEVKKSEGESPDPIAYSVSAQRYIDGDVVKSLRKYENGSPTSHDEDVIENAYEKFAAEAQAAGVGFPETRTSWLRAVRPYLGNSDPKVFIRGWAASKGRQEVSEEQ